MSFWIPLMVVMYQIVKAMQNIYIYIYTYIYIHIYVCVSIYLPVKVNERISLKQWTFYDVENNTPLVGLEPTISITYRVPIIFVVSQIIKTIHLKYICKYQWHQTKRLNAISTKIWIANVRWQPFWILRFVGKRCHLQLGIRQKWIQHKKFIRKQQMKYFS